jgi:uncharacterized membrane protein YeaQ/YmgE (transglycosylase-associated protein family)
MGIIGWLLLGLIGGKIAKTIHRGPGPGGVLGTLSVGVGGALLGGLIASAIGVGGISSFFSVGSWLIAIAGALLLLFLSEAFTGHNSRTRDPREVCCGRWCWQRSECQHRSFREGETRAERRPQTATLEGLFTAVAPARRRVRQIAVSYVRDGQSEEAQMRLSDAPS